MAEETTRTEDEQTPDEQTGEPGREEVAGRRGGQPGHDLDEGEVYEERRQGSDGEQA